ncbi:MAG: D-alanyl-D-alanine carboxypeptidase family protein [Agathobacter sp.]|nr:D-alanyl-D-alanine carboxypeptidase family protein [Agathobacter sp.]
MKCTKSLSKIIRLLCIFCVAAVFVTGCGNEKDFENAYDVYSSNYSYEETNYEYFSHDLCVTNNVNYGTDSTDSQVASGAGAFNLDTKEVVYSQNIFEKLYPASTTKILTAYIIIKYGNLDDMVTVSENASNPGESSSVCGIKEGDIISVNNLLYGLMLESGNDAAIALAEYYSGSVEAFADVMNSEAKKLGATASNFVNPHGLPDENHYTTVYDMYLIMQAAVSLDKFNEIINTATYDVTYTNKNNNAVSDTYKNTCHYITGATTAPEGMTVVGGKTGTTYDAGYCLVLYSYNKNNERIISIVFKADGRSNLYLLMNQILAGFAN